MPTEAEIVEQVTRLRTRQAPNRGVADAEATLPADMIQALISRAAEPQQVDAKIADEPPRTRPSAMGTGIGPTHTVSFELGQLSRNSVRYLRLVRAARLEHYVAPPPDTSKDKDGSAEVRGKADPVPQGKGVKLSHSVPGYVAYSKPDVQTGGEVAQAVGAPAAHRDKLIGWLDAEYRAAQWSFDGPAKEWSDAGASNTDRPGVASEPFDYPLMLRFSFIGILFIPNGHLLNVRHYRDAFMVLGKGPAGLQDSDVQPIAWPADL